MAGPPLRAMPWDRAKVVETVVGTALVTFADGNNATFTCTMNGKAQSKPITRQVFGAPGTICRQVLAQSR